MKIVRHRPLPGYHLDDTVGVALLLVAMSEAQIVEVDPNDQDSIKILKQEGAYFVDVGGEYDGERFFDHHHDGTMPCSAVLVATAMGLNDFVSSEPAKFMSLVDTQGIHVANRVLNVQRSKLVQELTEIITMIPMDLDVARGIAKAVIATQIYDSNEEFITSCISNLPQDKVLLAKKKVEERRIADAMEVKFAKVSKTRTGLLVVFMRNKTSIQSVMGRYPSAKFVVAPSPLNRDDYVITKTSTNKADLAKIAEKLGLDVVFHHANGFMIVLRGKVGRKDIHAFN